jgi:hypothetical protein
VSPRTRAELVRYDQVRHDRVESVGGSSSKGLADARIVSSIARRDLEDARHQRTPWTVSLQTENSVRSIISRSTALLERRVRRLAMVRDLGKSRSGIPAMRYVTLPFLRFVSRVSDVKDDYTTPEEPAT